MGARNSVNDDTPPTFHGAGDSEAFFPECLTKSNWEIARLFEQWLCKREKSELFNLLCWPNLPTDWPPP